MKISIFFLQKMAVSGEASSVYLFAVLTMATIVIVFVNFYVPEDDTSYIVFYIWESTILSAAILGLAFLVFTRNQLDYLVENVSIQTDSSRISKIGLARDVILIAVCATGSGILPFYQAMTDVSCMTSAINLALSVAKFISLVLSGIFFLLEFIFFIFLRRYRCKICLARILVSIALSANACMIINYVLNIIRTANTYTEKSDINTDENDFQKWVFSRCENNTKNLTTSLPFLSICLNILTPSYSS